MDIENKTKNAMESEVSMQIENDELTKEYWNASYVTRVKCLICDKGEISGNVLTDFYYPDGFTPNKSSARSDSETWIYFT